MNKVWQDEAWEDFECWMKQDKKTLKCIAVTLAESILTQKKKFVIINKRLWRNG